MSSLPANASSRSEQLPSEAISELTRVLPDYLTSQRWYRAKARVLREVKVCDQIPMREANAYVLIVRVEYADGEPDTYLLPAAFSTGDLRPSNIIARLQSQDGSEAILHGALDEARFRDLLLESISCERTFEGQEGSLAFRRTQALDRECSGATPPIESFVTRAQQSNSSVIYRDRYILKIFRKLESGINPDIETGRFLTERGFRNTPAVLGEIQYRPKQGDAGYAGILQRFVPNQGDAWEFTLESLAGFFDRALREQQLPARVSGHPLELAGQELPALARQMVGEYIESAKLLGTRTAEMHRALEDENGGPDFRPEPFTRDYAERLHREMIHEADRAFELLKGSQEAIQDGAGQSVRKLIELEGKIRDRFSAIKTQPVTAVRIRHHGDYHLGQVLHTGDDFLIIDFEGEPARPLADRRVKTLAMRDVAGMIRSFSYAAYAALFGQVAGVPTDAEHREAVEAWGAFWSRWVSAEFLKAYFEIAASAAFAGESGQERRLLFDAFVLQKALYEVAYELNNRPDWVRIPLRGILNLIG